ncbi:MAG: small multi-drug export protein [Gemmatimonadota bacterium]|nr:MAG: small multi-drug export protein [Gemmatimonadota bacterium]
MVDQIAHFLSGVPKELVTICIAMLPVSELRGAIPWALAPPPFGGGMTWSEAYSLAVFGNFIPVIPLLLFLEPASNRLRRYPVFDKFFEWLFTRTRRRGKIVERYEAIGLILFVAIPLPITGAWTGTVAAFIFGVRFWYALPAVVAGICIAGCVVTLASLGIISVFGITG